MVSAILFLVFLTAYFPIVQAARSNRQTTLLYAILWALGAWMAWMSAICLDGINPTSNVDFFRYLALSLTGCASVAVLGARRPGVLAWNFVILGLLTVMMFLWVEGRLAEDDRILHRLRTIFLASTVAIGILNYVPTRLAPAALLLALGCASELVSISGFPWPSWDGDSFRLIGRFMLGLVPWVAFVQLRRQPRPRSDFDETWLRFRNSFGMFWAERLREQFNQSAKNSDWPIVLRWQGLRVIPGAPPPSPPDRQAMLDNLRALMKRFGSPEKEVKDKMSHGSNTD